MILVTKYDRLAQSPRDLLDIVAAIKERGGGFRSLAEDIDTTTPAGRLIFHVVASIALFERDRISEGTREGREAAKKRGRVGPLPNARVDDVPFKARHADGGAFDALISARLIEYRGEEVIVASIKDLTDALEMLPNWSAKGCRSSRPLRQAVYR